MLEPEYQKQLDRVRELLDSCFQRFMCVKVIDEPVIKQLCPELDELVEKSKDKWLLPKDLLHQIDSFRWALDDVTYSDQPVRQKELADYFCKAFGCLLCGEGMNDREPGTPRIV